MDSTAGGTVTRDDLAQAEAEVADARSNVEAAWREVRRARRTLDAQAGRIHRLRDDLERLRADIEALCVVDGNTWCIGEYGTPVVVIDDLRAILNRPGGAL